MIRIRYHWLVWSSVVLVLSLAYGVALQAENSADEGTYIHAEKEINAAQGGILPVVHEGITYAYFGVYPGTIARDVLLTIDTYIERQNGQVTGIAVDFGPDGLQFAKPYAIFSLERPFLDLFDGARIAVFDEYGSKIWESDVIDGSVRRILVRFKHFSLYYFERR